MVWWWWRGNTIVLWPSRAFCLSTAIRNHRLVSRHRQRLTGPPSNAVMARRRRLLKMAQQLYKERQRPPLLPIVYPRASRGSPAQPECLIFIDIRGCCPYRLFSSYHHDPALYYPRGQRDAGALRITQTLFNTDDHCRGYSTTHKCAWRQSVIHTIPARLVPILSPTALVATEATITRMVDEARNPRSLPGDSRVRCSGKPRSCRDAVGIGSSELVQR